MERFLFALTHGSALPALTGIRVAAVLRSNLLWWKLNQIWFLIIRRLRLVILIITWRRDLSRESNYLGKHTLRTQRTLKLGMLLFIFSEVIFFFSFFWTFLHFSLNPVGEVGLTFPPTGIVSLNPFSVPLLNTLILVTRGRTLTVAHHLLLINKTSRINWLVITLVLGVTFTCLQAFEYYQATFTIMSANYGRIFFLATGFHGLHVLVGSILLAIRLVKLINYRYTAWHHVRFEAAAWYWHFVDVVWLALFSLVYWWAY